MEEKKPHKTIKQLLDEAGLQPTNNDWEKMQALLDKQLPTGSGKANPFASWHTWLITTGIVVVGIVGYFLINNSSNKNNKNITATHHTINVSPQNDTAASNAATIGINIHKDSNLARKQQDEQTAFLKDTGKWSKSNHIDTINDKFSVSPLASDAAVINNASKQDNIPVADGSHTANARVTPAHKTTVASSKIKHLQQEENKLLTDNHNSNAVKEKNGKHVIPNLTNSYNSKQQQIAGKRMKDSLWNIIADDSNKQNRQDAAGHNPTNQPVINHGTDIETDTLTVQNVRNNTLIFTPPITSNKQAAAQSDTAQPSTIANNNTLKNTGRKTGANKSKSNAALSNSKFIVGFQLAPLQLNINNSKKLDFNVAPGVHAHYTLNRVGVGVTLFPFVINSAGSDKFYSRADTTYTTDTLPLHRTITMTDYYTRKITSYKGALSLSYQFAPKLLLEAGVGMQHLTTIEAEQKQKIERDTAVTSIINTSIRLKSKDSLFKKTAQNTGFLYFNAWYTAGHCQLGIGYTQNGKSWFANTNNKAVAQLQFNIRYLLDFRKKK